MMIESLVAVLLLLTIGYCVVLNNRLRRLKADEMALKATISELITATEIAERAIAGLRLTVRDCDQTLGERLRAAERFSVSMGEQIVEGDRILQRLGQIAVAARPGAEKAASPPADVAAAPDADTIVKAAQAFAARTRAKSLGAAA
jgi:hypothetical protein